MAFSLIDLYIITSLKDLAWRSFNFTYLSRIILKNEKEFVSTNFKTQENYETYFGSALLFATVKFL